MVSDGRGRHGYALIALIVLVFLAGCVDYPPAWSVCLTCEEGIEGAATDGPNVSVSQSELFIQVREDGNGHWTVRSELTGPGVEALRSDSALVERFAGGRLRTRLVTLQLRTRYTTATSTTLRAGWTAMSS